MTSSPRFVFSAVPVNVENFFDEASAGAMAVPATDGEITEVERKFGIVLPEKLKQLYRYRNGGALAELRIPIVELPTSSSDDWRAAISDVVEPRLPPLTGLRWLYDSCLDSMTEEERAQSTQLPAQSRRYLVLSQRFSDVTVLDYSANNSTEPRVGIFDYERDDSGHYWEDVWFDSFDSYFLSIRRITKTWESISSASAELSAAEIEHLRTCGLPPRRYYLQIDQQPLTVDTFYRDRLYSHRTDKLDGDPPTWPQAWVTTPEMIEAAEARLNIALPPLLRKLYEQQNGGDLDDLWVPAKPDPGTSLEDWRGAFSHDYCYLTAINRLRTQFESSLDFMEPDEAEAGLGRCDCLPLESKRYVILCQRYQDTTFLDYSLSRENPRVGIVDFDGLDTNDIWFDSFDEFFAALRKGTVECEDD